jgi:hypothetical protein
MQREITCKVCTHMDSKTIDRFLSLPAGTPGKRGPRSLAPVFGVDRRVIAQHDAACLTDKRRERLLADLGLSRLGGGGEGSSYWLNAPS